MKKSSKSSIRYLNHQFKEQNWKNQFFPNPDQTKYENSVVSSEQIKQKLKWRLPWCKNEKGQQIFFFSEYQNKTFLNYFILNLARVFPEINHTVIWSSELSEQLFMVLRITEWKVKIIQFYDCKIGNIFSTYLGRLKLQNIYCLRLQEDPISNRGITQLFKLNMPHLAVLRLNNTDITNDIIKILDKKQGLYEQIVLLFNKKMNYMLENKASFLFQVQGQSTIFSRSKDLQLKTVYFPVFSKLHLKYFDTKVVKLQQKRNKTIFEQTTMSSRKTLQILSQMIYFSAD